MLNYHGITAAAFAASICLCAPAMSETYDLASFLGPTQNVVRIQQVGWAENVEAATNGSIKFNTHVGGSLLPFAAMFDGISNNVAQIGMVVPTFVPSRLPTLNAVSDMGFAKPEPWVLSMAIMDFNLHNEQIQKEWADNNVVYLTGYATAAYNYLCKSEVASYDDLAGQRIRVPSSADARLAELFGAVPVTIPYAEAFAALERGVIDCFQAPMEVLYSGPTVGEMINSALLIKAQPYYMTATLIANRDFWGSVSSEDRKIMFEEAFMAAVDLQVSAIAMSEDGHAWAVEHEIAIHEADSKIKAALDKFVSEDIGGALEIAKTQLGVENPEGVRAEFAGYIEKWEGLLNGADFADTDAIKALVKKHLIGDIDTDVYGL